VPFQIQVPAHLRILTRNSLCPAREQLLKWQPIRQHGSAHTLEWRERSWRHRRDPADGFPHELRSENDTMSYEPGTSECRLLIDSKAQIELALANLARLENTDHIRQQLLADESLHDLRRAQRPGPIPVAAGLDETD
jgi:hypothetical protein